MGERTPGKQLGEARSGLTPDEVSLLHYETDLNSALRLGLLDEFALVKLNIHDRIIDYMGHVFSGEESVLDVGCGNGEVLVSMQQQGHEGPLVGINNTDIFFKGQKAVEEHGITNVEFGMADAQDLPFKDNSFDAAMSLFVLYHVSDPEKALSEMQRVVKPEGKVIVATRGTDHLQGLWRLIGVMAESLGIEEPESFYPHFDIKKAREVLPRHFTVQGTPIEHHTPLQVSVSGWFFYDHLLRNMRALMRNSANDPLPSRRKFHEALTAAAAVFDAEVAANGYFQDEGHQVVFECLNDKKCA